MEEGSLEQFHKEPEPKGEDNSMTSFYSRGDKAARKHRYLHATVQGGSIGLGQNIVERLQDTLDPETADYGEIVQFIEEGIAEPPEGSKREVLKRVFVGENSDDSKWEAFVADFSRLCGIYYDTIPDETQRMSPAEWESSSERRRFNEYLIKILQADMPMLRVPTTSTQH